MSCKKVFFMKKIFFSFTKKLFYSCRKTNFFKISKNLTASAFLLLRQILYNGVMLWQKPTTEANFECCFLSNQVALCICWWQFWHNVARFDLALWKADMKTLPLICPSATLSLVLNEKKFYSKKLFETVRQYICFS